MVHEAVPFLYPHQQCMSFLFFPYLCQHLLFFIYFIITILMVIFLVISFVVLVVISLLLKDIEHSFVCLLSICVSPLENCPFKSFVHLLIGLFVFLLLYYKFLIYSGYKFLIKLYDFQIFSSSLWVCLLHFLAVFFEVQIFFSQ